MRKNLAVQERCSQKVKTCRNKSDAFNKKSCSKKKTCSETNIQNVQNETIHMYVTYIYIYPPETRCIIWEKSYIVNFIGVMDLICLPIINCFNI